MIRTNLTEILKRPLTLSTDAKAWKLVASAAAILLFAAAIVTSAQGQTQYPPLTEYLMPQDAEIALARSAAPANVSDHATIKVLNSPDMKSQPKVIMASCAWSCVRGLLQRIRQRHSVTSSTMHHSAGDQNTTAQLDGDQCVGDFALDPTTGECDPTTGPCPEGEIRGESGFCAVMPEVCPPGMYIDEDPLCEPCPTEGQIPEECDQPEEIEQPSQPEPEPAPLTNETATTNQTGNGNTTFVTINNAIAQAFSSTTYNTRVSQQAAQNTLLIGEETIPLQGLIKANGTRFLSTFDPFKLIGGSAIIYLPTSNISASPSPSFFPSAASEGSYFLTLGLQMK